MRICLVYDCLFPHTIGGGERWYRNVALRLRDEGHEVTYVTLRQWDRGEEPDLPGCRVVVAGPRMALYGGGGQRRFAPPLVFGLGVLWHLLRHGGRYDVVHTSSFPYFSLLAAALVRPLRRYGLVVDWFELWTRSYWREYIGRLGAVGWLVQRACIRVRQRAFCFARLTAERLRAEGVRGEVTVLGGIHERAAAPARREPPSGTVVFAGRLIPEKRASAVPPAVALAAARVPGLRGIVFGDGPQRAEVDDAAALTDGVVEAPGFVTAERLQSELASALCMILPSRREGYGLVVVEASALGVPSVVVRDPDNAAVELVDDGVNGVVAPSASPQDLADAIVRVHAGGDALRASTADWYARNAERLSLDSSLDAVAAAYRSTRA